MDKNKQKTKSQSTLTGAAGEHFIMFCLLQKGYIAGLAPAGSPNADIIATSVDGERTAVIQVKTRKHGGSDGGWHMKEKHEDLVSDNLYYCFVDFDVNDGQLPKVYIIPSKIVAEVVKKTDAIWMDVPGKNGRPHQKTEMRRLLPDFSKTIKSDHDFIKQHSLGWLEKYREKWEYLGL